MTYEEFLNWCNERSCDGCWGFTEAAICIGVMNRVRNAPFGKRRKVWKKLEPVIVEKIVNPTNEKIQMKFDRLSE